jgi:hypothetical protein
MKSNKNSKWIAVGIVIAFVAAGGSMARAAPPGNQEVESQDVAEPAGSNSGGVVGTMPVRASTPRAVQRYAMDVELIGTAVVEGGTSFALFQSASGTRLVREGDEIASGLRLVQVRRARTDVERNGIQQEIRLGSSEGVRQQAQPGSTPRDPFLDGRWRLREYLKEQDRNLTELLGRHPG